MPETCPEEGCAQQRADHCPTCGRHIRDFDDNSLEREDSQRWCMTHAIAAGVEHCIDNFDNTPDQCAGAFAFRMPLSGTGKSFLRCDVTGAIGWTSRSAPASVTVTRTASYRQATSTRPTRARDGTRTN